ncbi:MAG: class I adenylate-forming enzyme family protein [Hyphomicrobium sp.]
MQSELYYPNSSIPEFFNMAEYCIGQQAKHNKNKSALVVINDPDLSIPPSENWTFGELENAILNVSSGLSDLGLKFGQRLLIRLDNTSTYPILYFAGIATGLISIATSNQLTPNEAKFIYSDCSPHAIALSDHLPKEEIPEGVIILRENDIRAMILNGYRGTYAKTRAQDPAYLLYTSGTTANPKGVIHAHRVALGRSPTYQGWYGFKKNDIMLHAGAFNWTYTLGTGLIDPWANGLTSSIFIGNKDPEVWPNIIRKSRCTLFAAVPSLFRQILKYTPQGSIELGCLRHGLIAGETPQPNLFDDWFNRTNTKLYEALGMSEISTYISTYPGMIRKTGSPGRPQEGRSVAILPVEGGTEPLPVGSIGLLAIKRNDPGLMIGYWNRPQEEMEVYRGEWFIGGDLALMDHEGYIFPKGRANEVMKVLGYRVSPFEVEAVLCQHPDIAEVACTEISPRNDIVVIGAFLVAKPGHQICENSIDQFLQDKLAPYKRPKEYIYMEKLPRTSNGKIKRTDLKKFYANLKIY